MLPPLRVGTRLPDSDDQCMEPETYGSVLIRHLSKSRVGSDTLKVVSLPASPLVTSPVVRLPNPVAGKAESAFEDIDSLATLADGSVVIGRMFSSVLQLYLPDTGQFGAITLPVGMILEGTGSDLVTTPGGQLM